MVYGKLEIRARPLSSKSVFRNSLPRNPHSFRPTFRPSDSDNKCGRYCDHATLRVNTAKVAKHWIEGLEAATATNRTTDGRPNSRVQGSSVDYPVSDRCAYYS